MSRSTFEVMVLNEPDLAGRLFVQADDSVEATRLMETCLQRYVEVRYVSFSPSDRLVPASEWSKNHPPGEPPSALTPCLGRWSDGKRRGPLTCPLALDHDDDCVVEVTP